MSEEEIINKICKLRNALTILNDYGKEDVEAIDGILDLYNKEKERYKRIAEMNLKDGEEFRKNECEHRCIKNNEVLELKEELNKEKEKNEYLKIIVNKLMPLAECCYWDYENHTCTHTCRDCDGLNANNKRTETGILIEKDRYCRLYEDGYADEDTKFVNVEDLIKRHLKK